jgi:hypothetical protein
MSLTYWKRHVDENTQNLYKVKKSQDKGAREFPYCWKYVQWKMYEDDGSIGLHEVVGIAPNPCMLQIRTPEELIKFNEKYIYKGLQLFGNTYYYWENVSKDYPGGVIFFVEMDNHDERRETFRSCLPYLLLWNKKHCVSVNYYNVCE